LRVVDEVSVLGVANIVTRAQKLWVYFQEGNLELQPASAGPNEARSKPFRSL
jgi:hypothetical protein